MSVDPVTAGIKVGLMAAQMALTASTRTEGPRLDNLGVSLADYGTPINRFWGIRRLDGLPIIWAKKLKEKKVTSKSKGGKYSEYKYYGTWAVLIADHQIDAVRRLWFDKHLVYQTKDAGPVGPLVGLTINDGGLAVKLGSQNAKLYLGSEDQEPDPTIEAWCEDRYGPDSCPAYRGCAYIVFKNIPLEKFGNRIPQITCEAVKVKAPSYPFEEYDTVIAQPNRLWNFTYSTDFSRLMWTSGAGYEIWDVATCTRLVAGTLGQEPSLSSRLGMYASGRFLAIGGALGTDLLSYAADGQAVTVQSNAFPNIAFAQRWQGEVRVLPVGKTAERYFTIPLSSIRYFYTNALSGKEVSDGYAAGVTEDLTMQALTGVDWSPCEWFGDGDGAVWAVGRTPGAGATSAYFYRIAGDGDGPAFLTVSGLPASSNALGGVTACYSDGALILFWTEGGNMYRVDAADGSITHSRSGVSFDTYNLTKQVANLPPGSSSIWLNTSEIDLTDLSTIRTVNLSNWTGTDADGIIYDPINLALICAPQLDYKLTWRFLDRVSSDGVTLSTIVDDVADWCDIVVDADALDQTVLGYSVVQGTGKDMIAPLLDIHDSDCRPHDFTIQFIKRGGAPAGAIATSEFVREGDEARYAVAIAQDTDLPRRLSVNFADDGKDQQTNTVISQRPLDSVDGVREQTIDLTTYVTTPAEAQQLSDRRFRRMWNEREGVENALTMQRLGIEPGDVWTLSLDGAVRNARLDKVAIGQGRLKCEWKKDALTLAALNSSQGAVMEGRDEEAIYIPGPAKGFVLETPYLADSEASPVPLLHYAAGTYGAGFNFPGVILYRSDDDGTEFDEWNAVDSASRATWGYVTGALNPCDPWCWDRGSSLSIDTFGQALTTVTEAAIDADPTLNQAIIGGEVVNFTTATLESDGSYTVSGFKRGRRGTEWACAGHASGETFVLATSLATEGYGLSDVGLSETFKAQMIGRDPTYAETTTITLSAATLKPYAPARLQWVFDGTDLQGTITRRTRIGGSWVGGATIPLGEASEAYEVDIYNGATLKRTISVTGGNAFTYTAAMAVADGIALPTPPSANIYQMSADVGRGFALAA